MTEQERLDLYTSIVPNERQLAIQQMPFYAFIHYSLNTFTGKEWAAARRARQSLTPRTKTPYINKIEVCKTGAYRVK